MTGYVKLVHEWGISVPLKLLRLVVTGVAALSWGLTIPLNHVEVALLASDMPLHDRLVIEGDGPHLNVRLGRRMTDGTAAEGVEFPRGLHPLEVAEVAGGGGNLDVCSHHDLGMAACASELSPPAFLFQVRAMVKDDPPLEGHLPLQ
jgi:hypothetical protein